MANMQPAPMTMNFTLPVVPQNTLGSFTLDLSQCASLINRRFYRQGLNWAVAGFKFISPVTGAVRITKIPNTWVASNAWEKTFRAWNKQQMEAIEDAGAQSAVARFRDFKVFMDETHVLAGASSNLLPLDATNTAITPGEWQYSQVILPNAALDPVSGARTEPREVSLHFVGDNEVAIPGGSSRGIIEGYADSRAYPQSPDPVSPDITSGNNWLRAMFDVGNDNEEVTDNATNKNDDLPYDQINYPGGQTNFPGLQVHDLVNIVSYGGPNELSVQRAKGGNFPCGLVRFEWAPTGNSSSLGILIDLVPGPARGYLTEPMTEM